MFVNSMNANVIAVLSIMIINRLLFETPKAAPYPTRNSGVVQNNPIA
jgi:hypothetical protein